MEVYRKPVNTFVGGFLGSPPMNLLSATLDGGEGGSRSLRLGRQVVQVPDSWRRLGMRPKGEIVFGIRPEDVFVSGGEPAGAWVAPLEVEVTAVEALGAETVFIFALEGANQKLTARADRYATARRGDRLRVSLDLRAARVFDLGSTEVIEEDEA
jgi:multiple sugar transport system ATP-binding protein